MGRWMTATSEQVVLGDDWVRPQNSVDTEIRARRARRGMFSIYSSPLARKIVLFNMLALLFLVAGVLFTNPFRDSLVNQRERALISQVELAADVVGAWLRLPQGDAPAGLESAGALFASLTLEPGMELYLLGPQGEVLAQRRSAAMRSSTPLGVIAPDSQNTVISDFLTRLWDGLARVVGSGNGGEGLTDPVERLQALRGEAMAGRTALNTVRDGSGSIVFAVAAPVLDGDRPLAAVGLVSLSDDIDRLLRHEREQVLQMFVVALLVSVGLSLVLASTIANPLADLAAAAELGRDRNARRMTPGRVRIPDLTARPDEIGRLSVAMRGMVSALYDRIDANEQFAADVSHEIKNPLASLRSAVGTLRVAKREDQIARLLEVIEHDVRRLDRLVSDTSNASRLDSELVKEEEEPFNLCKTLDNLGQHLSQEAAGKGVEFISELPEEPIIVHGLEARLAQVFVNLITNAISFCEEGDAVRIWARKRENRVLVVVEDTGTGIPEQALGKIFKRFYSERPEKQFGNHSGLGLAISKQIVEAHGGVIWAENIRAQEAGPDTPPLGARFVVGLPV